jgi:hypothetical protein
VTGPSWIHGTKHDNCTSLTRARTPRSVATDEVRLEDDLPIITAALRADSPGGSARFSGQLANARPAAGVRAAFASGGALPFAASCLRLVVSLIWRRERRRSVNAYGVAARACSGAGPAGEGVRLPSG